MLACIDKSELRGKRAKLERANAARDWLRGMVVGLLVNLRRATTDRYGRTVGELYVDGMNVQHHGGQPPSRDLLDVRLPVPEIEVNFVRTHHENRALPCLALAGNCSPALTRHLERTGKG